jgi:hypothetical protein
VARLRIAEVASDSGNQPEVFEGCILDELGNVLFATRDIFRHGMGRAPHAECGVEVGAFEVAIYGDDALARGRKAGGEIRCQEGLPNTALSTTDRDESRGRARAK